MTDRPIDDETRLAPWAVRGMGLALGVAVLIGLIGLASAAIDVLVLLFVAVLLASALEPVVGSVRARLPVGRGSSILLVYLAFFVSVIGLALIVVPAAIDQGEEVVAGLPAYDDWLPRLVTKHFFSVLKDDQTQGGVHVAATKRAVCFRVRSTYII